ncbi:MAG: hypothetical protein EAZ78_18760 [Oscillatoriales cyanobacterium]|jgi:hypothetical protein|uniref:hypothetical protein n=1 Tax=Microcoleus TaxID=44471 RepID=UPI002970F404|nr:MAG: hypothetical protein EAZ78_18760 [Oscillatoriales cyanobacterium]TAF37417.1 MAG: hypothetical protein EAZ68_14690 [Oscillatoriales cyanobacterium]
MGDLVGQVEDFQKTLNQIMELMDDAKSQAGQLPDASLAEARSKVQQIYEICDEAIKTLNVATGQAEDIMKTVGG